MMEEKCLSEDVPRNELIVGDFTVKPFHQHSHDVQVKVTDPNGGIKYERERSNKGHFAFTSHTAGEYRICFTNLVMQNKVITFNLKTGVHAKDYKSVAKKDNLKSLEVELRRLEDVTATIHEELLFMKGEEQKMWLTNESTNTRIVWFSVLSVLAILAMGFGQLVYLRLYFKQKYLID